jgi:hypothetical protein
MRGPGMAVRRVVACLASRCARWSCIPVPIIGPDNASLAALRSTTGAASEFALYNTAERRGKENS